MDLGADNIGRRDQRFDGLFVRPGKFKGYALWDQIPMLMSQTTQTLFTEDVENPQGMMTVTDNLQAQVQAVPGALAPVFHSTPLSSPPIPGDTSGAAASSTSRPRS